MRNMVREVIASSAQTENNPNEAAAMRPQTLIERITKHMESQAASKPKQSPYNFSMHRIASRS